MSDSVRTIISANRGSIKPGDVYALNAPYHGGTHLPDVTVITPAFDASETEVQFYLAGTLYDRMVKSGVTRRLSREKLLQHREQQAVEQSDDDTYADDDDDDDVEDDVQDDDDGESAEDWLSG